MAATVTTEVAVVAGAVRAGATETRQTEAKAIAIVIGTARKRIGATGNEAKAAATVADEDAIREIEAKTTGIGTDATADAAEASIPTPHRAGSKPLWTARLPKAN